VSVPQPIFGRALVYSSPWRFDVGGPRVERPGPRLGEHSETITRELLGRTASDYAQLSVTGAIERTREIRG
jgi:crotonobetainyl-CoA:carnitine CoA-transferase CaiB-like acyl-CoA transferase